MGTQLPFPKKGAVPPIFGLRLLSPNGYMDQDATWYGRRPRPRRHCVRWGPSSLRLKGHSPQFSANVRCGQTAGWTKMPLGMEAGLGQATLCSTGSRGHISPLKKHIHPTQFSAPVYCGQTAGWMKTPLGTEVDLGPGHIVLDRVPAPRERGTAAPLFSAHVYCGHGSPSQLLMTSC